MGGGWCPPVSPSHWAPRPQTGLPGRGGKQVYSSPRITLPPGVPTPHNGLTRTMGTRVYATPCGGQGENEVSPRIPFPLGASIPQAFCPQRGRERGLSRYHPPTGRPYPPKRSARLGGLVCDRRCVETGGGGWHPPALPTRRASLSPKTIY